MNKKLALYFSGFIAIVIVGFLVRQGIKSTNTTTTLTGQSSIIRVVAAENFYGDIVSQLGGKHVLVTSILSDPNVDPHQYESNIQDAIAINKATVVIKNGDGYDTWMDKLLSASPNTKRIVLTGAAIADHKLPDNPHVWYGIENIQTIASKITATLKTQDSADSSEFDKNLLNFDNSLKPIVQKIMDIKTSYAQTPVGLTETIYLYQTQQMALSVLTPFSFEKAIAEGNDPSADDVAKANDQITKKQIKVLIYNEQTITPVTTNLQNLATQQHIPVVPVTETMPATKNYQTWMLSQLVSLQNALQSAK